MRDNAKRRADRARRKQLFERLRLQADILCDSYDSEGKASVILSRMLLIILDIVGNRSMNSAKREALANHFSDCSIGNKRTVELGGTGYRNAIRLDGSFDIGDLAKRIAWGDVRTGETIEVDHASQ